MNSTDDKHEALQATGKAAYDSIAEMVAALECDYDRLEELRDEKRRHNDGLADSEWHVANPDDAEDLAEIEAAAGDCESREDAEQRIHEDPLSVEVRNGWYSPATGDRSGKTGARHGPTTGTAMKRRCSLTAVAFTLGRVEP